MIPTKLHQLTTHLTMQKTTTTPETPAPPPNGGLVAWTQVVGVFFLMFNSWGNVQTFGAYQAFYETGILFKTSSANISWIGSLQAFLLLLVGSLTGPLYDAGHFRKLVCIGSLLIVFGQMMLSLCSQYWQAVLCQAICMGLGFACLFVPSIAILTTYFTTKMSIAVGVASSGSSAGAIIYSVVFYRLQPRIGFPWTVRTIGFIQLGTLCVSLTILHVRTLPPQVRRLIDRSAFHDFTWWLYSIAATVVNAGLFIPFFYIQYFALEVTDMPDSIAKYLLAIVNAAAFIGRIVPGLVADRIGPLNTLIPAMAISTILVFCFIRTHDTANVCVTSLLYGLFSASWLSLAGPVLVKTTPSPSVIGTRIGMSFGIAAFGVLIGNPIAGAILQHAGFDQVWEFSGACMLAALVLFIGTKVSITGQHLWKKS